MSSELEMCIESWRKYCPDYTIKCWNEDNSPMEIPWVIEAYKHHKWAFVADYMRFYALYHEGGVYMDTDMLLVRPIDEFLKDKSFLGREDAQTASMGIIGTEKGNEFAEMCIKLYEHAVFDFLKPLVITDFITPYLRQYGFENEDITQYLTNGLVVYKTDYFYPIPYKKKREFLLENVLQYAKPDTYGIHLWNKSWSDEIEILRQGKIKIGIGLVWKRFKRTPILPIQYWNKVIRACLTNTWLGNMHRKIINIFIRKEQLTHS